MFRLNDQTALITGASGILVALLRARSMRKVQPLSFREHARKL